MDGEVDVSEVTKFKFQEKVYRFRPEIANALIKISVDEAHQTGKDVSMSIRRLEFMRDDWFYDIGQISSLGITEEEIKSTFYIGEIADEMKKKIIEIVTTGERRELPSDTRN